jgi:hypothetical protein
VKTENREVNMERVSWPGGLNSASGCRDGVTSTLGGSQADGIINNEVDVGIEK